MAVNRWFHILGAACALLVPALSIAALNIPHVFSAGDVLSAQQLNQNFTAVKEEVEALQASVAALETQVESLSTNPLSQCEIHWSDCSATAVDGDCRTDCPAGMHPIAGGCDTKPGDSQISESYPVPPGAFPDSGEPVSAYEGWNCESSLGGLNSGFAICCPTD